MYYLHQILQHFVLCILPKIEELKLYPQTDYKDIEILLNIYTIIAIDSDCHQSRSKN